MTHDWTDHALRQLWADGINWRALVSSGEAAGVPHVEEWLQCRDTLPRREPFHRGFPTPERVVQRWAEHPDQVQNTPAEQQIVA